MCIAKSKGGLGFHDLEIFNDAMLVKQPWRLLDNTNSLCARVLKGRCYANGEILMTGCPAGASQTWQAIIKGKEMLRRGLIQRVGDGRTTEVWHDQWIEGTSSMRPMGALVANSFSQDCQCIPLKVSWKPSNIEEAYQDLAELSHVWT